MLITTDTPCWWHRLAEGQERATDVHGQGHRCQVEVPMVSVDEARQRMQDDPNAIVVDVRDASQIKETGIISGAHHVSLGTLFYKADQSLPEDWRHRAFTDLDQPIITTCETGEMASIAAKELKDLGYTNVAILEGGTVGWKDAGHPTQEFTGE